MEGTTTAERETFAYRPALDGLRAIAVLAVVLYHLDYGWAGGGFLGVDTFFVLSGYLITSLLLVEHRSTGRISISAFWVRRAKRLLPAVILLLGAVAAYAWLVAASDQLGTLRGDALATLAYVANWRFIVDDASYFDLWSEASPLRHMWSLAIEEQFYVAWPIVVAALLHLGRGRPWLLGALCGAGAGASVVALWLLAGDGDRSRAYFGTDTRVHTLLIGALLAIALDRHPVTSPASLRRLHAAGTLAGLLMLAAFVFVSDTGDLFYRGGSPLFAAAVAVVIAAGVTEQASVVRAALDRPTMRWIGQISYGLYLWHWPLIVWLTPARVGVDGVPLDAVRVAATFAAATVSYVAVERPIRHGTFTVRRVAVAVPTALALTAGVVVASTVGATTNPLDEDPDFEIAVAVPTTSEPATIAPVDGDPEGDAIAGELGPTTTTTLRNGGIRSVGLVGDSVAGTLAPAFADALPAAGVAFFDAHVHGCGVAAGFTVTEADEPFPWSAECTERVPEVHEQLIGEHDPDLVVWHSTWETADRRVDGTFVEFGTDAGDAAVEAEIDRVLDRLTAAGATVVILAAPPNAPSEFVADPDPSRMLHLTALFRDIAQRRDDLTVLDLNPMVCPGGPPCSPTLDGLTIRPDGGHYSAESAVWLVDQLVPALLD